METTLLTGGVAGIGAGAFFLGALFGFTRGIRVCSWLVELDVRGGIEALIERRRMKDYGVATSLPPDLTLDEEELNPPGEME